MMYYQKQARSALLQAVFLNAATGVLPDASNTIAQCNVPTQMYSILVYTTRPSSCKVNTHVIQPGLNANVLPVSYRLLLLTAVHGVTDVRKP